MQKNWLNLKFSTGHAFILSLAMAICSIFYQHRGIAHPEIYTYLPYYLSDRPLPAIIYDSKSLDMNLYQARELSYFFDYLDCKFIELSIRLGYPHFVSAITYLFLLMTSMLLWQFSIHQARLPSFFGVLLLILYWTSPSIFLSHSYFRSAKIGVTLLATILFLLIYRLLSDRSFRLSTIRWIGVVLLSLAMTLFDRQGVYFILIAVAFLLFWGFFFPDKNTLLFAGALVVSLLLSTFYNYMVGPFLTEYFNNYQPNFSYQHLRWDKLFHYFPLYLWAGTVLYLDTIRFLLGNIPSGAMAIGLTLVTSGISIRAYREVKTTRTLSRFSVTSLGIILCNVLMLIVMNMLMVLRHTPIFDPGVRRVYYWMPEATLLTLTLAFCLGHLLQHIRTAQNFILLLLVLAIAGNIASLPEHYVITTKASMDNSVEFTSELLEALDNIGNGQYSPSNAIKQNRIYHFFEEDLKQ